MKIKLPVFFVFYFALVLGLYAQNHYISPYSITFANTVEELIPDVINDGRGGVHDISTVPYSDWYTKKIKRSNGKWGPKTKQLSYPEIISGKKSEWLRERVIAVAQRLIGYRYQHHHIPDWDPPSDFPWIKTCAGKNGKGVDCSNFTSYVYNVALGVRLNTDIHRQAAQTNLKAISGGHFENAEVVHKPSEYSELKSVFQTGDLIFIKKNKKSRVSHVVIWLGDIGESPNGTPLIMDSHGSEVKDSNGNHIPCGIYIRPLNEDSWYWRNMAYGHRIIQ